MTSTGPPGPENDETRPPGQGPGFHGEDSRNDNNAPESSSSPGHAPLSVAAAEIISTHTGPVTPLYLLAYAITYAINGWEVFPLRVRDKFPVIPNPHPKGSPERSGPNRCKGE